MLPLTHHDANDIAGFTAQRFDLPVCGKAEWNGRRRNGQCQFYWFADDLAFCSFLPCLIDAAAHFQAIYVIKWRLGAGEQGSDWNVKFSDRTPDDLQEANLYREPGAGVAAHENLRLHSVAFCPLLLLGVGSRAEHAEVPALPVLHRRREIGIEHVSLVQDCVSDLLNLVE